MYGGQTTGRVQGAPGACTRQGNRCAAPASAQPGDPNPVPEWRLHRDSLPQPVSPTRLPIKKTAPKKKEAVLPKKPNFLLRLAGSLFSSCFLGSRLLGCCVLHCCLFSRRFSRRFLGGRFAP